MGVRESVGASVLEIMNHRLNFGTRLARLCVNQRNLHFLIIKHVILEQVMDDILHKYVGSWNIN